MFKVNIKLNIKNAVLVSLFGNLLHTVKAPNCAHGCSSSDWSKLDLLVTT